MGTVGVADSLSVTRDSTPVTLRNNNNNNNNNSSPKAIMLGECGLALKVFQEINKKQVDINVSIHMRF